MSSGLSQASMGTTGTFEEVRYDESVDERVIGLEFGL